jgi:5-methylcytosine-specific restriction endonuclease McrA
MRSKRTEPMAQPWPGTLDHKQTVVRVRGKRLRLEQYLIAMRQALSVEKVRRQEERRAGIRLRRQVLTEEPTCRYCVAPATQVDHRLAIASGGTSERSNLAALCATCHRAKSQRERKAVRFWL